MKTKSIYISSHEKSAGSLIVSMGMMEYLKGKLNRVAFFRPFIEDITYDRDTIFFMQRYSLDMEIEDTYCFSVTQAEAMIAQNKIDILLEEILQHYKKLESIYDFVLIEGLHQSSFSNTIDIDLNLEVAKNLGCSYINILKGKDKTSSEVLDEILIESKNIKSSGCPHFATFVNRLDLQEIPKIKELLKPFKELTPTYLMQEVKELDMPTIFEVKEALGCEIIAGDEKNFKKVVKDTKIASMKLENFLQNLNDGDLIIVSGDRADILVGSICAIYSNSYPNISGILLTCGIKPSKSVLKIIEGFSNLPMPIILSHDDTYQTAIKIKEIRANINPTSERKIALAMGLFNSSVDIKNIDEQISKPSSATITPIMFEYSLFQKASKNKKKIVLPESLDERILRACEILLRRDIVDIILLGNEEKIRQKSGTLGLDISKATIINPATSHYKEQFAKEFYELRKHKCTSIDICYDMMDTLSYFATMMVYLGVADGMVSGAVHTTAETIRPALQIIKTRVDTPIVSSLFFMCLKTRVLVYADCAINQNPTAQELATIAISSADTAIKFGIEPKIAMLSYSTGDSGKGENVEKVILATKLIKEQRADLLVEGPIQYDAAIDMEVAKLKLPNSQVAGRANIFIFPDLNTGNNTYKAVQRSSNAIAIGPILQGLKKPINDLSRGCLVNDIVNTVAITAIQANSLKDE